MNKRIIPPGDPRWRDIRMRAEICRVFRIPVRLIFGRPGKRTPFTWRER